MNKKKLLALICALSMFSVTGCLEDEETPEDVPSVSSEESSETKESVSDSSGSAETTASVGEVKSEKNDLSEGLHNVSLDENGKISISRSSKSTPMGDDGTWTVFVYMCGSDLESEYGAATSDLIEMCDASTEDNVKFVVQTGGASQWQNEVVSADSLGRFEIYGGEIYEIDSVSAAGMGEASTLADFLSWGIENRPAEKMGLILWNHGGGSVNGVCFDENDDFDSLSLMDLDKALRSVSSEMTDKFEFVGFDACLMGTVETANILASYSRYMIGSEELEPGSGWDYETFGGYISENPYASGAEVGQVIVDSFYESCAENEVESGVTLSVIDLSKIDDLIVSFNDFSKELYDATENDEYLSAVIRKVMKVDNYGGNNKTEGYTNMIDLGGFVKEVSDYADGAADVLSALDNAVVYMKNGNNHRNASGLSTYYPLEKKTGSANLKIFGEVAVSPYYLTFVDRVAYASVNGGNTASYDDSYILDNYGGDFEEEFYGDYFDEYDTDEYYESVIEFYDEPQLLEDGSYAFSVTDETLDYVGSVQAILYMLTDDGIDLVEFGYTLDVIADWDTGVFYDNFDGYWYSLPDGQILAVYAVEECDGYDIYTSPVILNGKTTNLRIISDYENEIVYIEGAWDGIDENGMASKDIYRLREGDIIVPTYISYTVEDAEEGIYEGDEYVYDGDPEIIFDVLYDADYLYSFYITDIFGGDIITDFTSFYIEDGEPYFYAE